MSDSTPTPKPKPRPIPRPRPVAPKDAAPAPAPLDQAAASAAAAWGRVDSEGNVWLRSDSGERIVGQYAAGGSTEDALGLYVRRYLDLAAQVSLLESRVGNVSPEESKASLKSLDEQLTEPAVIGDVEALRTRLATVREMVDQRSAEVRAEREAAVAKAIEERTALIERAEEIASSDPATIHWRDSREEFGQIFEAWKSAQKNGPRIARSVEEGLWQRYSKARTKYDRIRRAHFAERDTERVEVVARKKKLIARAEALSDSTDWGPTAGQYRDLMDEWRQAGKTARKDDDKLWAKFRAAQQKFFDARNSHFAERDAEFEENLAAKVELVEEAETILPIKDLDAAREKLHSVQDRWEAIGMVPRNEVGRIEGRLRKVEDALRSAEAEKWRKSDPQKKQRSDGMAAQLESLIAELDDEIAAAESAGNSAKVAELQDAKGAREAWLAQVTKDL
ncbi:MAG: DUF349 domain-containing protein [Ancrocorticia sp.]|uniref:DUF349 domain-containing protein n=1 Tax=Ancrocorticia sp. TaxID=2593684 RepID=UPI003F8DBEBD